MHRLALSGAPLCLLSVLAAQSNFPPPPAPTGNPVTADKALLGMALFFEEQLSSTGTVACATCHDFRAAGADRRAATARHPGPDGAYGTADDRHASPGVPARDAQGAVGNATFGHAPQVTPRRTPTVVNSGYHPKLFYDGRAQQNELRDPLTNLVVLTGPVALENLVLQPPVNPVEMGHQGRTWDQVANKVAAAQPLFWASDLPGRLATFVQGASYPDLFARVFGTPDVTPVRIVMAIATYLRTLNSDQSKYDRVLAGQIGLTPLEQLGKQVFDTPRNGAVSCRTCHGEFETRVRTEGPIVGQMTMVSSGPYGSMFPTRLLFHNVGVRPIAEDPGRQAVTAVAADAGKFRVASLRNVELMAPYFHNGGARTLREAIDFYDRGGDFHVNQSPNLLPRGYTAHEKDGLEALLLTLTDPRLAQGVAPFDRPRLGSENGRFVQALGPGLPTAAGRPVIADAPLPARLGEAQFALTLSGVTPGAFSLLLFDFVGIEPSVGNYNFVVGVTPTLLCVPRGAAPAIGNVGVQHVPMPLPGDVSFRGLVLFAQWLSLEPSTEMGIVTSNGLRIEIQ